MTIEANLSLIARSQFGTLNPREKILFVGASHETASSFSKEKSCGK
jgi:hypothetical protein